MSVVLLDTNSGEPLLLLLGLRCQSESEVGHETGRSIAQGSVRGQLSRIYAAACSDERTSSNMALGGGCQRRRLGALLHR